MLKKNYRDSSCPKIELVQHPVTNNFFFWWGWLCGEVLNMLSVICLTFPLSFLIIMHIKMVIDLCLPSLSIVRGCWLDDWGFIADRGRDIIATMCR